LLREFFNNLIVLDITRVTATWLAFLGCKIRNQFGSFIVRKASIPLEPQPEIVHGKQGDYCITYWDHQTPLDGHPNILSTRFACDITNLSGPCYTFFSFFLHFFFRAFLLFNLIYNISSSRKYRNEIYLQ
jgi:hypothetical protein